jgi:DNA polymerase-3 subunit gamma/tau
MFYYIPAWLKWWNEDKKAEEAAPESKSRNSMVDEDARYGESLLREMLGAEPMQDPKAGGR